MILKFEFPGITLELNSDGERETNYISLKGDYVNYKTAGYVFGYDGWFTELYRIENALAGKEKQSFKLCSIDEDFWFHYEPPQTYPRTLYDGRNVMHTIKERFWIAVTLLKDGALTDNYIAMEIDREYAQILLNYFRFVKGELSEEETLKMVEAGFFQEPSI